MNCSVCGSELQSGNNHGICQRTLACRRAYHAVADRPKPRIANCLALMFELALGLPKSAAREIAEAMSAKSKAEALVRFRDAIQTAYDALPRYTKEKR